MTAPTSIEPLYPSRAAAGAMLGRLLYQRCPAPTVLLGITPTGVELAANAAQAMSCPFDVIVGAHVRLEGVGMVGAIAEDSDAVTDPEFAPRFDAIQALEEALEQARRAVKTERLLFRGQRPLRALDDVNVAVIDGNLVSPWKALAAAQVALNLGARKAWITAAASTQAVQERIRARRFDFICPSVVLEPAGHPRPFGDPLEPSAERLRSIVVARQAA